MGILFVNEAKVNIFIKYFLTTYVSYMTKHVSKQQDMLAFSSCSIGGPKLFHLFSSFSYWKGTRNTNTH